MSMNPKLSQHFSYVVQYRHAKRAWHFGGDHDTLEQATKHTETLTPYWDGVRILVTHTSVKKVIKVK